MIRQNEGAVTWRGEPPALCPGSRLECRWIIGKSEKINSSCQAVLAHGYYSAGIDFSGLDPIKTLLWAAIVNGVISVPIMVVMMLLAVKPAVMGEFVIRRKLKVLGWLATAVMALAVIAMFVLM